ncbi:flagellar hook-length control protein FliK [Alphaproteobacteria bacterium]|nr:flagellar hook-length control protein FliK [Alphaproteobacteria bacterium]
MPIITASSSSDISPQGPASSAGKEAGSDVLFAALFGAVVSTDDTEEIDVNLDILQAMTQEEHPDKQDGEGALATALLFAVSDEPANYLSQDEGDISAYLSQDEGGIPVLGEYVSPDDEGDVNTLIESNVLFHEKEEGDAGLLAASQLAVQGQVATSVNAQRSAGDRPLTTQLLTKIAEDLAPEHVVIKEKVSITAGQTSDVDSVKTASLNSDKVAAMMSAPHQNVRAKLEASGPVIIEMAEAEAGESFDALALKTTKTESQIGLTLRPAAPNLPTAETSTLLQGGVASEASPSAGNQGSGSQTSGGQTSGGQSGLTSSLAENWLEMLDMQDENWAEQLVKRVERNLANAKEGIDFELNPRSLGKLHVNLSLQQNEAQLQMRTETSQAAQMISDAQSRLSAMLEDAGMKLAYLGTSTQSNGNGANGQQSGNGHHGHQNNGQNNNSDSNLPQNNDATDASNSLVNVKA